MGGGLAAPPRRDQALAYIIERIARSGVSPTLEEIGLHLGVSRPRAGQLVDQLVERGLIERTIGTQRNLRVRDVTHARSLLEDALRRLGWSAAIPMGEMQPPFPLGKLPVLPPFEHLPDL
jgi:DNA-binding MarR family transcriptional regulator